MSLLAFTVAYMLLLCPESREIETPIEVPHHVDDEPSKASTLDLAKSLTLKFFTAVISPIVMFAPRSLLGYPERKSYSLTFVGAALFMCLLSNVTRHFSDKALFNRPPGNIYDQIPLRAAPLFMDDQTGKILNNTI